MSIAFTSDQWARLRRNYARWWDGELSHPIVGIELHGRDPGRPQPATPLLAQATCADLSIPVDDLVDRIDWELSTRKYLGDAYPRVSLDSFGPGVMAAFLGAKLDNSTGRVWFHPVQETPITDMQLVYDPDNLWLRRIKDLVGAMARRWQGQVLIGLPDLGGNLDVLSTFFPGEQLLLELYDHPEEVKRLLWQVHELWHRYYAEIMDAAGPTNPGFSSWCGIYCAQPYYMLQCDFAYMIGPGMFGEFVLPELAATTRRLGRSFYHLDGVGQLPHLDQLLTLPELDGVQWVPGDGQKSVDQWPEVFQKIIRAGKKAQVIQGPKYLATVLQQAQIPGRIECANGSMRLDQEDEARRMLGSWGVEA